MKKNMILASVLAFVVVAVYVYADSNSVSSPNQFNEQSSKMNSMPQGCPMMGGKGDSMMMGMDPNMMMGMQGNMMNQCMNMMRNAGISEDTIRQWQTMANTPQQIDDPAAILGRADELGLSQEQRQKLLDILKESREKTLNVLTEDQRKKIGKIMNKPMTMMEMCQSMQGKMMPMMQEKMKGMGPMMMMCPMMQNQTKTGNADSNQSSK